MSASGAEAGREALSKLDSVLAKRPKKDDQALSDATSLLCVYRDTLIAAARRGGTDARERLSHLNAILSVVAGMRYPLGEAPWDELRKARGWLAELLAKERSPTG